MSNKKKRKESLKYSALISVYYLENPSYLKKSLFSIINQTLLPNEVILIQDGIFSVELLEVINDFKVRCKNSEIKIAIIKHSVPCGLALSLNEGIEYATNEFIARFDSDDISCSDRIEKEIKMFEDSSVSVVGSFVEEFSDNTITTRLKSVPCDNSEIIKYAKKRNPMNHMSVIFKKSIVNEVGNYDKVSFFEDYLLWAKIICKNQVLLNIPEVLVYARTENDFVDRRRGLSYAKDEIYLQQKLHNLGLINCAETVRNIIIRASARIVPKYVIKQIYKILRN